MTLRVLDLFSGIGGFSLGLEQTGGFETVAFCEVDAKARLVLAKHWPSVPCYDDVRTLTASRLREDGAGPIDVICGGFPCQDISLAGRGAGLGGERSGLWWEFHRLVGEIRPAVAIIENVAALRSRGLDVVLGSLAALGYDAEWHCIPAAAVGAPHRRDRIWIVAHADGPGLAIGQGIRRDHVEEFAAAAGADWWLVEPDVGRVADGVPGRVDRLRQLGNAVVPQIPFLIGRAILAAEGDKFSHEQLVGNADKL